MEMLNFIFFMYRIKSFLFTQKITSISKRERPRLIGGRAPWGKPLVRFGNCCYYLTCQRPGKENSGKIGRGCNFPSQAIINEKKFYLSSEK